MLKMYPTYCRSYHYGTQSFFPGVVIPITLGRDKSIKLIKESYKGNKVIGVVAQRDGSVE